MLIQPPYKPGHQDQKNLQLDWYCGITKMVNNFRDHNHQADPDFSNQDVLNNMLETFIDTWKMALTQSKKLVLYQSLKDKFGAEPYLNYVQHQHRSSLTNLRLSSHPLAIETGRYDPHGPWRDLRPKMQNMCTSLGRLKGGEASFF